MFETRGHQKKGTFWQLHVASFFSPRGCALNVTCDCCQKVEAMGLSATIKHKSYWSSEKEKYPKPKTAAKYICMQHLPEMNEK